ncbi:ABC transporter ATP-binding protein [Enterococcus faecalis]|uniref:ABC transporter ATP-binding protein n=1 Tax=Enterococcus faecalis TaxID=1351 RepID=UPI001C63D413|nr:ABC transporter ATP-binding protein [Enterococcus faecalis]MBW7791353.1 ABC transporter ATP-binding protein [Enterococcus faecalis]
MIKLDDVSFKYQNDKVDAIKNINLDFEKGKVYLLCGKSGCGKTSIIRTINRLIPNFYKGALYGKCEIYGENIEDIPMYELSKKVGTVFQNPRSQFYNIDTTSELVFNLENQGVDKKTICKNLENVIDKFKIDHLLDKDIFNLSGGEKQLIACASLAVSNPDIIVMDEPSSNLDKCAIKKLSEIIKYWKKQNKTIIIAEHRIYYLMDLIDEVIFLENGEVKKTYSAISFKNIDESDYGALGLRTRNITMCKENKNKIAVGKNFISIENYFFSHYKDKQILNIKNCVIPKNHTIAIIGNNGSGKTTFSRCLCGLERKFNGKTVIDGKTHTNKEMLKKSFLVMQDVNHQLFTESVNEEIRISTDKIDDSKINEILDKFNLKSKFDSHPMTLSGGEKQRLAIITALVSKREILIFDEPTSGLDRDNMLEFSNFVKELSDDVTKIIVTHDYELILETCDYVIHLEDGEIKDSYFLNNKGNEKLKDYFCDNQI